MLISVIIINFNSKDYLRKCAQSVLASTVPVEVFVIDNCSEDQSLSLLKNAIGNDPRLHVIENKQNLGFARASNQALPMTKGEYILFLNPDCLIRPDTLECMLAVMEAHPDAGIAGCLIRNPDGSEQAGSRRYIPTPFRSMIRVLNLSKLFHNIRDLEFLTWRDNRFPIILFPWKRFPGRLCLSAVSNRTGRYDG